MTVSCGKAWKLRDPETFPPYPAQISTGIQLGLRNELTVLSEGIQLGPTMRSQLLSLRDIKTIDSSQFA
jgi:hypothetical protein